MLLDEMNRDSEKRVDDNNRLKTILACVQYAEASLQCKVVRTDIVQMTVKDVKDQTHLDIGVGVQLPARLYNSNGEKVVAIFEANIGARYLVLTSNRGVVRGVPYRFGDNEVLAKSIRYVK